jgi:hypothetical protein
VSTDVSEEHIASIFRVEEEAEQETSVKAGGKQSRLTFNGLHGLIFQKIVVFLVLYIYIYLFISIQQFANKIK